MKQFAALALAAVLPAVSATPMPTTTAPAKRQDAANPLAGYSFYVNPYYSSEVHSIAIPSLSAAGSTALAAAATKAAEVGSFYWL